MLGIHRHNYFEWFPPSKTSSQSAAAGKQLGDRPFHVEVRIDLVPKSGANA
jgi:hypothetical protein